MTSYFAGDKPAEPLVILPPVELAGFTAASVIVGDNSLTTVIVGDEISAELEAIGIAGLYPVRLELSGPGSKETYDLEPLVIEERTGWHTLASARRDWNDAPLEDATLYNLLTVARGQVEAYAPALPAPVETAPTYAAGWIVLYPIPAQIIPTNYKLAQLIQARNVWTATKADAGSGGFDGDFAPAPSRPLDWHVKNLLRPARGVPRVG